MRDDPKLKLLLVEDDASIAELVRFNFEAEGFDVVDCATGEDALLAVKEESFDLVILDWMLPGVSGLETCRRLRNGSQTKALPVLMLTARGEEADKVRGLTTGADDYVVKPFSIAELVARGRALIRRASPSRLEDRLSSGDIMLDRQAHRVTRGRRNIELGPTEFRLLLYFMEHRDRVLSRQQLLDGVWGRQAEVDERTVDVHVGRLRKLLVHGQERDPVRTVRGSGYAFGDGPE